ncbi:hypothetical protein VTL71DRAFT_9213 [Oculimacula yallundae]|uniref:Uncharacterized protein n=1 Tax=Oculimacula yallundae TaxID=86028 RepID=A0ABR4BT76_9HELO
MSSLSPPNVFNDGCTPGQRAYLQHIDTLPYSPWLQDWPDLSDAVRQVWEENGVEQPSQTEVEDEVRRNLAVRHKKLEEEAWHGDKDRAEGGRRRTPVKARGGIKNAVMGGKGKGRQLWGAEDRGDVGGTVTVVGKKRKPKEIMESVESHEVDTDAEGTNGRVAKRTKATGPAVVRQLRQPEFQLPLRQHIENQSPPAPSPVQVGVPLPRPTPEPITPTPLRRTETIPSWLSNLRKLAPKSPAFREPNSESINAPERDATPILASAQPLAQELKPWAETHIPANDRADVNELQKLSEEAQETHVSPYESINNVSATPLQWPTPPSAHLEPRQYTATNFQQPLPAITNSAPVPRSDYNFHSTYAPPFGHITSQARIQSLINMESYQSPYNLPAKYVNPYSLPSGTIYSVLPQVTGIPNDTSNPRWDSYRKPRPTPPGPPLYKFTHRRTSTITPTKASGAKIVSNDDVPGISVTKLGHQSGDFTGKYGRSGKLLPLPLGQERGPSQDFASILGLAPNPGAFVQQVLPSGYNNLGVIKVHEPASSPNIQPATYANTQPATQEHFEPRRLHHGPIPISPHVSRLATPREYSSTMPGPQQQVFLEATTNRLVTEIDEAATSAQQKDFMSTARTTTSSSPDPAPEVNLNSPSKQRQEVLIKGIEEAAQSMYDLSQPPPSDPELEPPPHRKLSFEQRREILRGIEDATPSFDEEQDQSKFQTQSEPVPEPRLQQQPARQPIPSSHPDRPSQPQTRTPLPSSRPRTPLPSSRPPGPHPHPLPPCRPAPPPLPYYPAPSSISSSGLNTSINTPPCTHCILNRSSTFPCRGGPPCGRCRSAGRRAWECEGEVGENPGKGKGKGQYWGQGRGKEGEEGEGRLRGG